MRKDGFIYREGDAVTVTIPTYTDEVVADKLVGLIPGLPRASARVFVEAARLQAKKNADYADSKTDPYRNFRQCAAGGIPVWKGVWVRMTDKWSRLQKFVRGGELQVTDETGRDTLVDLINYACICLATFDEGSHE